MKTKLKKNRKKLQDFPYNKGNITRVLRSCNMTNDKIILSNTIQQKDIINPKSIKGTTKLGITTIPESTNTYISSLS